MDIQLVDGTGKPILRCATPIETSGDALAIVAATYEHDASGVLLEAANLPAAFFDLRSGFAGEFIQKLVNYRLAVAAVFSDESAHGERFREYIQEARSGRQFRTFGEVADALRWLGEVR